MNIHAATRNRGLIGSARADAGAKPGDDPKAIFEELQKAFAAFKEEREQEIKNIKAGFDDVVTKDKVDRINNDITQLQKALDDSNAVLAAMRVGSGSGSPVNPDVAAHSQAFNLFFRKGIENGLKDLEVKAKLTTQSDPDGGYLVPTEMESTIDRVVGTVSAMRSLSRVITISTDTYKKLVSQGGATSGWVGEEDSRSETNTPTLREIAINTGEIYAQPAATATMLDDARIDVAQWLADEVSIEFAEQEGDAFVNGDGKNKPRGLLSYDTVANASYAWGKLGFTVTGGATGFASSDPADALINLFFSLKQQYRGNATWLTSDAVMGTIRKFKDGDGNYLWAPPQGPAGVATILGKPVATDDNMPALGASAFPVAFADFNRGYHIVDRAGIRVLRDNLTSKPNILFYTTKRVGGGVVNFEAIKLLKCST